MTVKTLGNIIFFSSGDTDEQLLVTLPDGYSIKRAIFNGSAIKPPVDTNYILSGDITFPVVNGMSPNQFNVVMAKNTTASIIIEEFGGKPTVDYFEGGFHPTLIKDGSKEYNLIASEQFK